MVAIMVTTTVMVTDRTVSAMIDIHCHLIPGIDDGARDMADALSLLRLAKEDGINRMVLTPHIHVNRFDNSKEKIFKALKNLKAEMVTANIDLAIAAAAEVRIDAMILPMIERNLVPFLGEYQGQKFLLLELPHSHIPPGSDKLVSWLIKQGIKPVIAHPERNRDILNTPAVIKPFQRLGCWFQLTASSLTGGFGENSQQLAEKLLKDGIFNVVASDAHNHKKRPPVLSHAFNKVSELCNEQTAEDLFITNPFNITQSLFSTSN